MFSVSFNGIQCESAGVLVMKRPGIPAPVLEQDEFNISGRDSVLLSAVKKYGPIDIDIDFNFMRPTPEEWGDAFRRFKKWAAGTGQLTMSDDTSVFYKVLRTEFLTSERSSLRIGAFTVRFRCDPFTYLSEGLKQMTITEAKFNPYFLCKPTYYVTRSGNFILTVNGKEFSGTNSMIIDTEKMQATDTEGNLVNTSVSGEYSDLWLNEGANTISTNYGTLRIVPNWRML